MKKLSKIATVIALGMLAVPCFAQSVKDVRINEVLVKNENSYMDDYGQRLDRAFQQRLFEREHSGVLPIYRPFRPLGYLQDPQERPPYRNPSTGLRGVLRGRFGR